MPPDVRPYPEVGSIIEIGPNGAYAMVIATDEDDDEILMEWTDDDGHIGTAIPFDGGSQLTLEWDEELDGQVLTCFVTDGHPENDQSLRWYLEVL